MIDHILAGINLTAAVIIFCYCAIKLSTTKWRLNQPDLWAHAMLIGGAVGVIDISLIKAVPSHPAEIWINSGMAVYFLSAAWAKCKTKKGQ